MMAFWCLIAADYSLTDCKEILCHNNIVNTAPDKLGFFFKLKNTDIFSYFSTKNKGCGYSLEGPNWSPSYEYPQHIFLWEK